MKSSQTSRNNASTLAGFRAKASNDPCLFLKEVDGRSVFARRFRDLVASFLEDLGGQDAVSTGEVQLIRRASAISCLCETLEVDMANGQSVDIEKYNSLVNSLNRCLGSIGLRRRPKNITPTLTEYVKEASE